LCSVTAPSRTLVVYIDALLFHAFIHLFHNIKPNTSAPPALRKPHNIREHPIIIIILKSSQLSQTSTSLVQQAIPSIRPTKTHHLQTLATTHTQPRLFNIASKHARRSLIKTNHTSSTHSKQNQTRLQSNTMPAMDIKKHILRKYSSQALIFHLPCVLFTTRFLP